MYEEWLEKNGQDPNKLYSRDELYCLNENLLMEMANISREDTKLPYEVWIDSSGVKRVNEHTFSPRIKIQVPGIKEWIPITISDDPEIPDNVKNKNNIKYQNSIQLGSGLLHIKRFCWHTSSKK